MQQTTNRKKEESMHSYSLTTGLITTKTKKFKDDKTAWNVLSRELNLHYGIQKNGINNGVMGVLVRHYTIYSINNRRFDSNDFICEGSQDLFAGMIRLDFGGKPHKYSEEELSSVDRTEGS